MIWFQRLWLNLSSISAEVRAYCRHLYTYKSQQQISQDPATYVKQNQVCGEDGKDICFRQPLLIYRIQATNSGPVENFASGKTSIKVELLGALR